MFTLFESCPLRELMALSAFVFERAPRNIFSGLCFANWRMDSFPSPAFPRNVRTFLDHSVGNQGARRTSSHQNNLS